MVRRRFERSTDTRSYRKLFILAVEGEKTEHEYFALFNGHNALVRTKCLKGKGSSPSHVLQRIKKYLREEGLKPTDVRQFTVARITQAIARAQKRDTPPCMTWPHASGVTTVYRLVSNILKEGMPVLL